MTNELRNLVVAYLLENGIDARCPDFEAMDYAMTSIEIYSDLAMAAPEAFVVVRDTKKVHCDNAAISMHRPDGLNILVDAIKYHMKNCQVRSLDRADDEPCNNCPLFKCGEPSQTKYQQ